MATLATASILATPMDAKAQWFPRQERYKRSNITQWDLEKYCARTTPNGRALERFYLQGDEVVCVQTSSINDNYVGKSRSQEYNSLTYGSYGTDNMRQRTVESNSMYRERVHLNHVCNWKHNSEKGFLQPNPGMYVGDGMTACYNSYWRWRR